MKNSLVLILICISFFFSSSNTQATETPAETCNFFIIKEIENDVIVEKTKLKEGEFQVIKDEGYLNYVPVFSPGSKSGDLITLSQRQQGIIVGLMNGKIIVKLLCQDGTQKDMPTIDPELASQVDTRINITGANGFKKAVMIEQNGRTIADHGPVMDMFAGAVELKPGDYSFMIESLEPKSNVVLEGSIPYELYQGWLMVKCTLESGKSGKFVVDFGAATTVISQELLPEYAEIETFHVVEYSSEGKNVREGTVAGASGEVDNVAGISLLKNIRLGTITLDEIKVQVLKEFPRVFAELGINGIIGRDVLMRTDLVEITGLKGSDDQKLVFMKKESPVKVSDMQISFNFAGGGQIFIDGSIQDTPIHFFFDSGASHSSISQEIIKENDICYSLTDNEKRTAYGLDGKGLEFETIEIDNVQIGELERSTRQFDMTDIFALQQSGAREKTALLGMDFLLNYKTVCFDLVDKVICLWK